MKVKAIGADEVKVKKGEDVVIKSEIFNNFDYDLKKNPNIYLAKFRTVNKNFVTQEIDSYKELLFLLENMKEVWEDNINQSFEFLSSMFLDLSFVDSSNIAFNKNSITSKFNKIKKVILDLKKDFEQSENILLKEYIPILSNIILVLNRFPNLLREFEDNIKNKKEQRKRIFQNVSMQISKLQPEIIRKDINSVKKLINSINSNIIPSSIISFFEFYVLYKAKLPTNISKDEIIAQINQDKDSLNAFEIDFICGSLGLTYTKDIGFYFGTIKK